ncbi:MAG: hypothetical protein AB7J94_06080 [Geobacter sp.]|jgi:hypothetical protein
MPNKDKTKSAQHLRNIISFRVSDQELDLLERLRGDRSTKLSTVLRQLLKLVIDNQPAPSRRRSHSAERSLKSVTA